MLRTSEHLHCDRCDAVVARCERGWRGYVRRSTDGSAVRIEIVCPACSEQLFGEDENDVRSARWR